MVSISLSLPNDISQRLGELSKETGRTKSSYIKEALISHLEDLEDISVAEQRLIEIRAGKSKLIPIEELAKEYGLDS